MKSKNILGSINFKAVYVYGKFKDNLASILGAKLDGQIFVYTSVAALIEKLRYEIV